MHRLLIYQTSILLGVVSLAPRMVCAEAPAGESTAEIAAAAQEFISLLQQGKSMDAAKNFDATMQQALPADQLQAAWDANVTANGKFLKLTPGRVTHVEKWDIVDTPCVFEKATVVVRLSYDDQKRVAGLYFMAVQKPTNPADEGLEIKLETAAGALFGTLDLPTGNGPWPIALVIAGSGPTDRDGNQPFMKNDCLRMLGKALAAQGIAALRFDKRGVGKNGANGVDESKLQFEDYVADAAAWVKQLRGDQRFNKVIVVGHSEGSLVGILAAQHEPIDALVSISGSGRDLTTLLRSQLQDKLPPELREKSNHIIDELQAGRKVDEVPTELMVLFRPSVQPYLISWLKYQPANEIASLKIPILVVQGTTDLQVSLDDAKQLANNGKSARLFTIDNMNHVMKKTSATTLAEQIAVYSDPALPLAPHLVDGIVSFIKQR